MLPAQCRAARGLLDWTQLDLVKYSGVAPKTVADFERGLTKLHRRTLDAIISAFEVAGIEFINRGVRLRATSKRPRSQS
jgi:transcriptional regulator with XRE-family HTH domain